MSLRARKAAIAVLGVTLALAAVEAYYRHLGPARYHNSEGLIPDDVLGHRSRPGNRGQNRDEFGLFEYRHNAYGSRGPDLPTAPAEPGVERVLLIGDSFLDAWAVREERHLVTTLRERLEQHRATEVYALACSDWGTGQELLALRKYGPQVDPDAVVLFAFLGNDVANNSLALAGEVSSSTADYIRPYVVPDGDGDVRVRYVHPVRAFLRHRLASFARIERDWLLRTLGPRDRFNPNTPRIPAPERLKRGLAPLEEFELYRNHPPDHPWSLAWRDTELLIDAFRDHVEAMGARFLLVVIPTQYQVFAGTAYLAKEEDARAVVPGYRLEDELDLEAPEQRLAAFCAAERIEALLMLDDLRAAAAAGRIVYGLDAHLTWEGHEVLSKRVAATLSGDERAAPVPPRTTSPVRIHDAATTPSMVTLDTHAGLLSLAGSFWPGIVETPEGALGRYLHSSGVVAVRPADGPIRVDVTVMRDLPQPSRLVVSVLGASTRSSEPLQAKGPVTIVVPGLETPRADLPPILTLRLSVAPPARAGIVVHRAGFEPDASAPAADPLALFGELDADGDGRLSLAEVPEAARGDLASADTDGDGAISRAELAAWLAR